MSILTKYILKKYLINFIIVLISLELFFVGIDFLQNFKKLPESANLQLLYLQYNAFFTLTLALPLSIVFGWIVTLVMFVRSNELVAFNSVGSSQARILSPIIKVSIFLVSLLVFMQTTPLAYSYEEKKKILNNQYFTNSKSDIFLKYDNHFVYFKKLIPLAQKAEDIHIYKIEDKNVVQTIIAKNAYFQNNRWYVVDAKVINKPKIIDVNSSKLDIKYEKFLHTLEGFKPKILDSVYETKSNFSILDAVSALILLNEQGINTDKIRAALYNKIFVPFFVIPLIFIIFAYASANSRFFKVGEFTSLSIFGTLVVWGIFFMLFRFTTGGIIIPEISILLPFIIWILGSLFFYNRKMSY